MMWWMMAADAAGMNFEADRSRQEAAMAVFAIPDERDEEFADFMFSRKTSVSTPMESEAE